MANYNIEVAVTEGTSTTERGNLLQDLMRVVFDATGYASGPAIRVTGMEIDVTATHKVTNEEVYAECRARREPLPAEALAKLLGNVIQRNVNQGWLVSTSRLSKDAEGWKTDWENRAAEERRKLQIYHPPRLLELLINSKHIVEPSNIQIASGMEYAAWYLLLTNIGDYWACLSSEAGVPTNVTVYNAKTGELIDDAELLQRLQSTDTSLRDFYWLVPSTEGKGLQIATTSVLETVVDVAVGDAWADYRPARPQDFVGRQELQNSMKVLFSAIRNNSTTTRLFAIRAPSGWGKSSLVAKMRDRCSNYANRNKFHMVAVDMRAAKSANYVSAALLKCFSLAVQRGFILPPVLPLQAGTPAAPLESESIQDCLQQLRATDKVIILIFDQFEEVLTKPELRELFDRLHLLALSLDAQKENIALGFAWKSDAFLPQDHPAYFLWHQLKDRRLDLDVPRFGSKDVSQALALFQTELRQRINPVLRSQLVQHCQGFPWLLKKLCIHVFNLVKSGLTQTQVLERGLDIKALFEADLSDLSNKEMLCLKEIARLAPVEWVQIVDQFGNDTYTSLLDRRLIIRSGDRLNPYWDIFRDYLRTGEIPKVPVSFLPGTEVRTLVRAAAVTIVSGGKGVTVGTLSNVLSINNRSAGNVVRDIQMFGIAERQEDRIISTLEVGPKKDLVSTIAGVFTSALNNHVFTILLRKDVTKESVITEQELFRLFGKAFPYASLRDDTRRVYALRLAKYLTAIRFLERTGMGWRVIDELSGQLVLMPKTRGSGEFLGDAPPEKVIEVMRKLADSPMIRKQLNQSRLRNAVACAIVLGIVKTEHGDVYMSRVTKNLEDLLKGVVVKTKSFKIVSELVKATPTISAVEIGRTLSEKFKLPWSEATCIRRGNALRKWVRWCQS